MTRRLAPLLVAVAAFALAIGRPPADPDMFSHLASGRWMVAHGEILRVDVFSSTAAGQPYGVGEWLGEVVLYAAYALGGWSGIVLLRGVLVAVAAFFVTRLGLRAGPAAVALPLVTAALLLSTIVWTDRPHLFTLALFPLLLDLLLLARAGRSRLLFIVPPLLLVWTDLHGGSALGLALVVLFAIEAVLRRTHAGAFVLAAIAGALATLLDPGAAGVGAALGAAVVPSPYDVAGSPPDVLRPAGFLFALFVLGVLAVALRSGGTRLDALVLVPSLLFALSAERDTPYFAIAAIPYLARSARAAVPPRALDAIGASRPLRWWSSRWRGSGAGVVATAALAVGLVAATTARLVALPTAPDETLYPAGALAAVRAGAGALLNEYDWGGYLIWRAPERPVYVDGRRGPYPKAVLDDWNTAVTLGPTWRAVLERGRITTVLLRPERPLVGALREDGWHVAIADPRFVVLERP